METTGLKLFTFSDISLLNEESARHLICAVDTETFCCALKLLDKKVLHHLIKCARNGNTKTKIKFMDIALKIKEKIFISEEEALAAQSRTLQKLFLLAKNGKIILPPGFAHPAEQQKALKITKMPKFQQPKSFTQFMEFCPENELQKTADLFSDEELALAAAFSSLTPKEILKKLIISPERQKTVLEKVPVFNPSKDGELVRKIQEAQTRIIRTYVRRYEKKYEKLNYNF